MTFKLSILSNYVEYPKKLALCYVLSPFISTFKVDIEFYVKKCNVFLTSKSVRHKPYDNLQSFPISIYQWKDLCIDFVNGLLVPTNWKGETYDLILVIVNWLIKIV